MKFYLTAVFSFVTFITSAQFSDDFEDGDFLASPTWIGTTGNFEINAEKQLHLLAPAVEDTSYLAVFSSSIDDITWDFWVKMEFNPSSGNYSRVYLVSDQANLKGALNGYFVMIGNTSDEISLYRQTGLATVEILDGVDASVNMDEVTVRLKITRDGAGNWELLRDTLGGYTFISEGTVLDNTHSTTSYSGVYCKYTSSRSELFYFDNVGNPYIDLIPPTFESVTVISSTALDVYFSEPVDPATAEVLTNYTVDGGINNPTVATVDGADPTLVHLTFATAFTNGTTYQIEVINVEDLDGNSVVSPAIRDFLYFVPVPAETNDVIFTEVLADPNPVIGLPEVEFFEIHNRSAKIIDLANWTVNDNSTTATFGSYIIAPLSYVVICGVDEGVLFGISNVLEVDGLPTLTNTSDDLVLKDNTGLLIDSIRYFDSWYDDTDKKDGGWTMERRHLNSPCSDNTNWGASLNPAGGTPGAQNSIWTDANDITAPLVADYDVVSETEIALYFNESLDTLIPLVLSISPTLDALSGAFVELNQYRVDAFTLQPNTTYNLTITNGQDCWGNEIDQTIQFGLPGLPQPEDIILNEILFDPLTGGSDYVELYNNSDKIIDLHQLYLANWDENQVNNYSQIGEAQYLLLPGEYVLLTEDSTNIIHDFPVYGVGRFLETDLPTYPNDSGTVFLTRADSVWMDYFHYDSDLHFALLNTEDGKALERISFGGGMNNTYNWHTASENSNWGTPGYVNSQSATPVALGQVSVDPQLFSPDNDGYNDVLTINFDLSNTDNILDVSIYDNQGRLIRLLEDNYFMGQKGLLTWDGINDDGHKAAIGTYIVLVSIKTTTGDENLFKLVTVLGGNL